MTLQISDKSNWKTILSGIEISLECLIFASFHREPKIVRSCSSSYFKLWTFVNSRAFQSIRTVKCMWKSKTFLLWKGNYSLLETILLRIYKILIDKKKDCWIPGVEGGPKMKTEVLFLPKKMIPLGSISCCKNIFLGCFLVLVYTQKKPILWNVKQRTQVMSLNPCTVALSLYCASSSWTHTSCSTTLCFST